MKAGGPVKRLIVTTTPSQKSESSFIEIHTLCNLAIRRLPIQLLYQGTPSCLSNLPIYLLQRLEDHVLGNAHGFTFGKRARPFLGSSL
jgi:hypothetical protein